jgi:hypothetical protein
MLTHNQSFLRFSNSENKQWYELFLSHKTDLFKKIKESFLVYLVLHDGHISQGNIKAY